MIEYGYGWEKLFKAVGTLIGPGPLNKRLADAVIYNVIHINAERDLPPDIRNEFKNFMENISSVEAKGDEGDIQATVNTLDEGEINKAAGDILSFYDSVCRHQPAD